MKQKFYFIIGGLFVALVLVWWFTMGNRVVEDKNNSDENVLQGGVEGDPLDVTMDFYTSWLEVAKSSDQNPYTQDIASAPILSAEMQERIKETNVAEEDIDPVLCQNSTPDDLRARPVFKNEDTAQILITPRNGDDLQRQVQVTLKTGTDGWLITDITCTNGEVAPEREFSFERDGQLLKDVPPPLNSEYWHLVFEQDNVYGHTVPLFFSEESVCISKDGIESTCDPNAFVQTVKVHVAGEMTESGLGVKRLIEL